MPSLLLPLILLAGVHLAALAAVPVIATAAPGTGPTAGGTAVTLTGTGLADPTGATVGGTAATIVSSTATSLVLTTPAHAAGVVGVTVTTAGGTASLGGVFTYAVPWYAPVFASWPSSTAQDDGAVPAFSTGQSEALAVVGRPYAYQVVVSGNPAPTTLTLTRAPAGMLWTRDASCPVYALTGTITWTPTAAGAQEVAISVGNSQGTTVQAWRLRAIPAPAAAQVDGKDAHDAARPLKIMCLGDSITVGFNQHVGSYRTTLFRLLTQAGYQVEAVGASTENGGNVPGDTVNTSHEGFGGWAAFAYSTYHSLALLMAASPSDIATCQPDVVVVMAGTNDIANGPNTGAWAHDPSGLDARAEDHMGRLIDAIWNAKPATRIIVLPVLHNACPCSQPISAANSITNTPADQDAWNLGAGIAVQGVLAGRTQTGTSHLVTVRQRAGRPITFADANRMAMFPAGWDPTGVAGTPAGMSGDGAGVHPSASAYQNAIAQAVFRAVLDVTAGALDRTVPPSTPSGLTGVAAAAGLDLAWTANSLNEERFQVDWSTRADFTAATTVMAGAGVTATTLANLPGLTPVYVRVRACNGGGSSWYAPPIQVTTGTVPLPVITTASLPAGTVAAAYSQTLAAANAPTSWTVVAGSLPAGLALDSATGVIGGTPTAAATSAFTVVASNSGGAGAGRALSIAIARAIPVITLSALAQTYDGTARTVGVSTTPPGLAVAVTYAGDPAPPMAPGSYAIVATIDDARYAGSASGVLVVARAQQTISFPPLGDQMLGSGPVALAATATSGLPPVFSVISGPGAISGSSLTLTGTGTLTIAADQAGDAQYQSAPQRLQTILVTSSPAAASVGGDGGGGGSCGSGSGLAGWAACCLLLAAAWFRGGGTGRRQGDARPRTPA